jgi:hypothetical protein
MVTATVTVTAQVTAQVTGTEERWWRRTVTGPVVQQ